MYTTHPQKTHLFDTGRLWLRGSLGAKSPSPEPRLQLIGTEVQLFPGMPDGRLRGTGTFRDSGALFQTLTWRSLLQNSLYEPVDLHIVISIALLGRGHSLHFAKTPCFGDVQVVIGIFK